jgi:hypothetical protein
MMDGYTQFANETLKRNGKGRKKFKVQNSWGVYSAYKHMRKNHWYNIGKPVSEHDFYSIIRGVNLILAKELANGSTITFPSNMGKLELRKSQKGVSIVGGMLRNTYPIDWVGTLNLWYNDEEERNKRTLLRKDNKYVYRIKYCKFKANYENKCYYSFILNRDIKIALKNNIENRLIDTLW